MGNDLCFNCDRPFKDCEWMSKLAPVPGWEARMKKCKVGGYTYHIKKCPKYIPVPDVEKRRIVLCVCPVCGRVFEREARSGGQRIYCSARCRLKAAENKRRRLICQKYI